MKEKRCWICKRTEKELDKIRNEQGLATDFCELWHLEPETGTEELNKLGKQHICAWCGSLLNRFIDNRFHSNMDDYNISITAPKAKLIRY